MCRSSFSVVETSAVSSLSMRQTIARPVDCGKVRMAFLRIRDTRSIMVTEISSLLFFETSKIFNSQSSPPCMAIKHPFSWLKTHNPQIHLQFPLHDRLSAVRDKRISPACRSTGILSSLQGDSVVHNQHRNHFGLHKVGLHVLIPTTEP